MKKFKWTVEIEIDESQVADGLELTDENTRDMVLEAFGYMEEHEVRTKVIQAPDPEDIKKAQGY